MQKADVGTNSLYILFLLTQISCVTLSLQLLHVALTLQFLGSDPDVLKTKTIFCWFYC